MGKPNEPPYTVPNYSYFQVAGCKPLEELQHALRKKGLCDPWIRNEVWRFHKGFGSKWSRARAVFFRGAIPGAILAAITVIATNLMPEPEPEDECVPHWGGHH